MGIEWVQERRSRDAIGCAALVSSGIRRPGIAADHVIARAAGIIRVVNPELRVVENVERFRTKFHLTSLGDPEMLGQRHIEIYLAWVVQKISASVAESQPAGSHKLRGVPEKRTKALQIVRRLRHSLHNVGIRRGNSQIAGDSGVVGNGYPGIARSIDNAERRTGMQERYTGNFPAIPDPLCKPRATFRRRRCRVRLVLRSFLVGPV